MIRTYVLQHIQDGLTHYVDNDISKPVKALDAKYDEVQCEIDGYCGSKQFCCLKSHVQGILMNLHQHPLKGSILARTYIFK